MPAYEILAKLAQGATAELFAARATDRIVVIKRLRAAGAEAAKAFLAESLVAATHDHPNIVKVFDVGTLGGRHVVTREYVDGETLAVFCAYARLKRVQVPLRAILTIAAGAAEGLQYAHERSMHGDLSMPNVIVSHDGTVKLLEVTSGDRSGDLVALGRALWELLTLGDPAASPDNAAALPAPSTRRFDIPQELDTIVVRLLAGEYESADDVVGAIDLIAAKLGFQLSPGELSRMMRLWFGVPPAAQRPLEPVTVTIEPVSHDVEVASTDEADDPLAAVRDDDDARNAVTALASPRARDEKVTAVPGFGGDVDATREHFEQIRDRILEHARKKKDTRPPIPAGAFPSGAFAPAPSDTETAPLAVAVEATPPPGSVRRKPDTLDPNLNPYAYITRVAETASAPMQAITKGETSAAAAALQAAQTQADTTEADIEPATGRVATLRMGEVVARPAPQAEPRVGESSPVKLAPELLAATSSPDLDEANAGSSSVDETVVVDEIALPRPGRLSPAPPLASVAAVKLGDSRSPHTRRTAEMTAVDVVAEDARAALVDTRSADAKARDNARTTAQIQAVDIQELNAFEADAARLAYAKSIDSSTRPDASESKAAAAPSTSEVPTRSKTPSGSKTADRDVEVATRSKTPSGSKTGDRDVEVATRSKTPSGSKTADGDVEVATRSKTPSGSKTGGAEVKVATRSKTPSGSKAGASSTNGLGAHRPEQARADERRARAATPVGDEDREGSGRGWLVPGLVLIAVAAGIMVFAKRGDDRATPDRTTAVATQQHAATAPTREAPQPANAAAESGATGSREGSATAEKAADETAAKLAADEAAKQAAAEDAARKAADDRAAEQAAQQKAADERAAKLAAEQAAQQKAADDKAAKADHAKASRIATPDAAKDTVARATRAAAEKPAVEAASIEQLFAAGDYPSTNTACTNNDVFTPLRLKLCALSACHTNNTALAKRWVSAIAKTSRDEVIAQCTALGLELESAPPAAPAPAAPSTDASAAAPLP